MDKREEVAKYKKNWINKRPWLKTLYSARSRCKNKYSKRGIKCLLTPVEIKKLWYKDKAWLLKELSIDRIDNNKNYTYDNCRFIELRENTRLGNLNKFVSAETRRKMSKWQKGSLPWNAGLKFNGRISKKNLLKTREK